VNVRGVLREQDAFAFITVIVFTLYGLVDGLTNQVLFSIDPVLFWIVDVLFYTLVPLACLVYLREDLKVKPEDYGLRPHIGITDLFGTTILFLFLLVLTYEVTYRFSWVVLYLAGLADLAKPFFLYKSAIPSGLLRIPAVAYLAISAGVIESVVFIGLPWFMWRKRFGRARNGLFMWSSAAAFAAVHWEQGALGVAGALAFGLLACGLYLKVSDLWPIVGAHTLVDFMAFW
jgi:hypothetical protein